MKFLEMVFGTNELGNRTVRLDAGMYFVNVWKIREK